MSRYIDAEALDYSLGISDEDINFKYILSDVPTADVAPVVHGEWVYAIKKGSCMDYSVTAKCSNCGWDWFSNDGVGNYSAVFGAFITNGDSKPDSAKTFLLQNAKANNKFNCCPICGARMGALQGKE